MLCDQKSPGSSPRRATVQSLRSGFQLLPASEETSIWYLTSGLGGQLEATWATATTAWTGSLRGEESSRVTARLPKEPSTTWAWAWGSVGPAETSPRPLDSKVTFAPPSFRRGMTETLSSQTVRIVRPDPTRLFAPAPRRRRYCRKPFT